MRKSVFSRLGSSSTAAANAEDIAVKFGVECGSERHKPKSVTEKEARLREILMLRRSHAVQRGGVWKPKRKRTEKDKH